MDFGEFEAFVLDCVPDADDRKILQRAINRTIGTLNSKITGVFDIEKAYEVAAGVVTTETGYSYDEATQILTLPTRMKELRRVYLNDVALDQKTKTYAYDSDHKKEGIYAVVSRDELYLPDAETDGDVVEIAMLKSVAKVTGTDPATIIDVPPEWEEILLNGVLYYLTSMPNYRDEVVYEDSKEKFYTNLRSVENRELDRTPMSEVEPDYKY